MSVRYVDAGWVRGGDDAAAFAVDGARLELPDGSTLGVDGQAPEDVAIAVLASLAARAAGLARSFGGDIAVVGTGLLARFTRILLGLDDEESERPVVIVDTVGSAESIAASLRRLGDLGALVLAAPAEAAVDLDLYPDAHRRGLTIAGMPLLERPGERPAPAPDALVRLAHRGLDCAATNGSVLWYRRGPAPAEWDGATPNER
jgi:hypothetical protein